MRYFLAAILHGNGSYTYRLVQAESKEQAEEKVDKEYRFATRITVEETIM